MFVYESYNVNDIEQLSMLVVVIHEGKGSYTHKKSSMEIVKPKVEKIEKIEKRLKCESCEKSYDSSLGLKLHVITVHEGKSLFNCDRCPKKFNHKSNYEYHYNKDHILKDQGINETNYHEHSENPMVAEILRRKENKQIKGIHLLLSLTL